MFDKFFEQFSEYLNSHGKDFGKDFFENLSTNPNYYYYRITTTVNSEGKTTKQVDTNIPSLQTQKEKVPYISEPTVNLKKAIEDKRLEMKKMAESEKFEEALELKNEIAQLNLQLESAIKLDQEQWEKNKSARERLADLTKQLDQAVKDEDYETAAKLRDQIKGL